MTSGQRVILNTIATYTRTLFSIALGLFSGRWILEALGDIDYGLMGVVGSLIGFISVLNGIVSGTCARFFALSIGKGDVIETNRWFNTALSIHIILPTVLVIIGWPIGEWLITYYCNIPSDRLITAQLVFSFSLVSTFVAMLSAPYMGMLVAKQRIFEVSLWQIVYTICSFCFVYWLLSYKGNSWLVYSIGSVCLSVFFTLVQAYRSKRLYQECSFNLTYCKERGRYKEIVSFASWQLFGGLTGIFRNNLVAILLNKYYPPLMFPAANASMQIGTTVSSHTSNLSTALRGALTPELTSTEGRGDRQRMLLLSNHASKFSCLLILLISIPLCIEIKEILDLWLKTPPEFAWYFSIFYIGGLFVDNLTSGYMIAINAVGRIKWYQITVGGMLLIAYPLSWILVVFFKFDYYCVSWALFATTLLASMMRVIWARILIEASIRVWLKQVLFPLIIVLILSSSLGIIIKFFLPVSEVPLLFVITGVTVLSTSIFGYIFIFTPQDRIYFKNMFVSMLKKIKKN